MLRSGLLATLMCCFIAPCVSGDEVVCEGSTKCEAGECTASNCSRGKATTSAVVVSSEATKCSSQSCEAGKCQSCNNAQATTAAVSTTTDKARCSSETCQAGKCDSAQCQGSKTAEWRPKKDSTDTVAVAKQSTKCDAASCSSGDCASGQCPATRLTALVRAVASQIAECQSGTDANAKLAANSRDCNVNAEVKSVNGKAIVLSVDLPGHPQRGVPIVTELPYVNRLFKNIGVPRAKIVMQLPREKMEAVSSNKPATCTKNATCATSTSTSVARTNAPKCDNPGCSSAAKGEIPDTGAPVMVQRHVQVWTTPNACSGQAGPMQSNPVPVLPRPVAVRVYNPATLPPPGPCAGPVIAQMQPPILPPTRANGYATPPSSSYPPAVVRPMHHPAPEMSQQLLHLATENARLRAHAESREEISRIKDRFQSAIFEIRMENAQLHAQQAVAKEREELIGSLIDSAVENARLEARIEYAAEREELISRFAEAAVEKAQLEACFESVVEREEMREEMLDGVIDTAIDNARLEATIEFAQQREALVTEMIEGRLIDGSVNETVEAIAVELEREKAEKTRLKAKLAELERLIQEVSARSGAHPIIK